ncbi:Hypothetical protein, putative [Bodo saltans]|uniref:Secreted protein n=1 Tax=Bodo saltans TaxID=75058 RepID=A0A0S4IJE7_BODSA|nr:Hypothetical protein, putative [Bodo saltans]|eukprot:CUE82977.1 Hypothetical protein, putative [Bodo saltans]
MIFLFSCSLVQVCFLRYVLQVCACCCVSPWHRHAAHFTCPSISKGCCFSVELFLTFWHSWMKTANALVVDCPYTVYLSFEFFFDFVVAKEATYVTYKTRCRCQSTRLRRFLRSLL